MDLNSLWFILIGVLFTGYFLLEGFDFGVGILLPFLGRSDNGRRVLINSVGPHWDGNEVWLITAGGAIFAAFPQWYATLFSGFYFPLFLILLALIVRGAAFEFRSKDENPTWRALWDGALFIGSVIPALLWGVAFANLVRGVPINEAMQYTGGFWNLLNPYALLGGIVSLVGFTLHGAIYLSLKTTGDLLTRVSRWVIGLWIATLAVAVLFVLASYTFGGVLKEFGWNGGILLLGALLMLLIEPIMLKFNHPGWMFVFSSLAVILFSGAVFVQLFPNVMISSTDAAFNMDIYNAASSQYTLTLMSKVALFLVPLVLLYQGWTYWVFRKRLTGKVEDLHY